MKKLIVILLILFVCSCNKDNEATTQQDESVEVKKDESIEVKKEKWMFLKRKDKGKVYYGIADTLGNVFLSANYDSIAPFDTCSRTFAVSKNGSTGILSESGRWIISLKRGYDDACWVDRNNNEGYYLVKGKEFEGACDASGKEIIAPDTYLLIFYYDGTFMYESPKNGRDYPLCINLYGNDTTYIDEKTELLWRRQGGVAKPVQE
jgi:hypothetical protein